MPLTGFPKSLSQIANRSHTLLTDIGTNTHAQIDTHLAGTGTAVHGDSYLLNTGDSGTGAYTLTNASGVPLTLNNGAGANNILVAQDNGSAVFTIADGGNIGAGITPDSSAHLYMSKTHSADSDFWGQLLAHTKDTAGTGRSFAALDMAPTASHATGTLLNIYGFINFPTMSGAGTVTNMYGAFSRLDNSGAGTIDTATGYYAILNQTGAGTVTSSYGILIADAINSGGGSIVNQIGIYIGNPTKGSSLKIPIYEAGDSTNSGNILGSNTKIGAVSLPAVALDVSGGALITTNSVTTALKVNQQSTGDGFQVQDNGTDVFRIQDGSKVGFHNTAPAAKQTVTGSRGGNAALASLLTALATYGLITDSSSA